MRYNSGNIFLASVFVFLKDRFFFTTNFAHSLLLQAFKPFVTPSGEKVVLPEGIILEPLPPYSPELQPAERLWTLADEPLVNKSFATLDDLETVLAQRCQILAQMQSQIQALTTYHWWPDPDALETGATAHL